MRLYTCFLLLLSAMICHQRLTPRSFSAICLLHSTLQLIKLFDCTYTRAGRNYFQCNYYSLSQSYFVALNAFFYFYFLHISISNGAFMLYASLFFLHLILCYTLSGDLYLDQLITRAFPLFALLFLPRRLIDLPLGTETFGTSSEQIGFIEHLKLLLLHADQFPPFSTLAQKHTKFDRR